jgi:outer membrane immunogenic protein
MKFRLGIMAFTLTSVAALGSANAADMYRAPEPAMGGYKDGPVAQTWTGFYAGINGGYGWSADDSKLAGTANGAQGGCPLPQICKVTLVSGSGSKAFDTSGGFGGGQIGFNWQPVSGGYKDGQTLSHFVFGIEADIQGAGIDGTGSAILLSNAPGTASATGKNDLDWFGTVRGRLGYAMDATLLYFTGGFAFGSVRDTLSLTTTVGSTPTASKSETETGFVIGGGVEHLFSPRWSAKIEYQYIDLGDDKLSAAAGVNNINSAATLDAEHKYHTVRAGLNYHFDRGYEPLK